MKTLRRPMFRRGGEVDGGITSGMRSNFSQGSYRERFDKIMQDYAAPAVDPIAQLLIQGGLRGYSETGGGSTLGNLAKAFEPAVGQAFQTMGSQRAAAKQAALTGLEIDIGEEKRKEDLAREEKYRTEDIAREAQQRQQDIATDLGKIDARSKADIKKLEREYELKDQYGTGASTLQKDYSPERVYYETLKEYTDPKAAGYITTIQQEYPEAFAEFAAYIGPSIIKNENLKGGFIGTLPNRKKGKTREYIFDEMIPGAIYFKPDTKRLYERDPEQNILIEYDPYSGKKLREIPLQ